MPESKLSPKAELVLSWRENPCKFVWDNFKVQPDPWQEEFLKSLNRPDKNLVALKACVGPGKTAALSWAGLHFLSCRGHSREHPKGAAVSITADNLKDNLWPEFSKWMAASEYLTRGFEWTKERIHARAHPETWFISARTWSRKANTEELGRTLSGLHSQYVLVLLDESGDIPPPILRAGKQALSNCRWGKIIQAGNPTSQTGVLYLACSEEADLWLVIEITGDPEDPKAWVHATRLGPGPKAWAQEQIKLYGRDNPWVMATVLGKFPPGGINSLISPDEVDDAIKRVQRHDAADAYEKRMGIDVARFGDDRSTICRRQGPLYLAPIILRNVKTTHLAARAANEGNKWGGNVKYFFDVTGGLGAGPYDQMSDGGYEAYPVNYSERALEDQRFFNKRSEILWLLTDHVKTVGCLPNDPVLKKELTVMTYSFQNGKLRVEEKDQIKKRLGFSPDLVDGYANTHAVPEKPQGIAQPRDTRRAEYARPKSWHPHDEFSDGGMMDDPAGEEPRFRTPL